MILKNVITDQSSTASDITVRGDKIVDAHTMPGETIFHFDNAIAFPGLINAHDHLDFNLFPSLVQRKYANYTEWGHHLHTSFKKEIAQVTQIPTGLRAQWGLYKNLLNGVTTVVNHGVKIRLPDSPINVLQTSQCLHSVKFERLWKLKLNNPVLAKRLCEIHIGEGTDECSLDEINDLLK